MILLSTNVYAEASLQERINYIQDKIATYADEHPNNGYARALSAEYDSEVRRLASLDRSQDANQDSGHQERADFTAKIADELAHTLATSPASVLTPEAYYKSLHDHRAVDDTDYNAGLSSAEITVRNIAKELPLIGGFYRDSKRYGYSQK
jgi:hypothetical protein